MSIYYFFSKLDNSVWLFIILLCSKLDKFFLIFSTCIVLIIIGYKVLFEILSWQHNVYRY